MRNRVPFLFSLLALTAACSSSSSSPETASDRTDPAGPALGASAKIRTCKNQKLNPPRGAGADACDGCVATSCRDEGATMLGTDPEAFGGVCKDTLACLCECDASDVLCLAVCPPASDACKEAMAAAQKCEHSTCASTCGAR